MTGFAAVVGNPPYQQKAEGARRADSIYHHFMEVAERVSDSFVSMVYPSKWQQCGSGEGIEQFRERELNSSNYVSFFDYTDSYEIFFGVNVVGGLNWFLWDKNKHDENVGYFFNGDGSVRKFLNNGIDPHIRSNVLSEVFKNKIATRKSLSQLVGARVYYGSLLANAEDVEKASARSVEADHLLRVFYVHMGQKIKSAMVAASFTKRATDDYKVFVSKAVHGKFDEFMPRADRILYGSPGEIASDTFLKVGSFSTEQEAINAVRYLKTDFCNFLLAIVSPTQVTNYKSYLLLPDVNFRTGEILDKSGVFLDFSQPESLDDQLCEIYGITVAERHLMTKDLKPWKSKVDETADK